MIVLVTIAIPIRTSKDGGVAGAITNVKRPRKNKVAFGFKAFVRNPILTACNGLISLAFFSGSKWAVVDFAKNVLNPIKHRYKAPAAFMMLNAKIDFEII